MYSIKYNIPIRLMSESSSIDYLALLRQEFFKMSAMTDQELRMRIQGTEIVIEPVPMFNYSRVVPL